MSALSYLTAWRPISARIHGLERAATLHASHVVGGKRSPYGAPKDLQRHFSKILQNIIDFQGSFSDQLPPSAKLAISDFLKDGGHQITGNTAGDDLLGRTIIVKLIAFEAEMTYCLESPTEQIRSASEIAFIHLQRLIVVDKEYRKKWQAAHNNHETDCEQLGAVHLLWHGILAFKVDAAGGKTDLVYPEPLGTGIGTAPLGIVLTEWKRTKSDPAKEYATAKTQADLYASGVLAGLELTSHRYLVVVTKDLIVPPTDIIEGPVTYRHINIAVDPQSPSKAAKKLANG